MNQIVIANVNKQKKYMARKLMESNPFRNLFASNTKVSKYNSLVRF